MGLAAASLAVLLSGGTIFVRRIARVSTPRGSRILPTTAILSMAPALAGLLLAALGEGPVPGIVIGLAAPALVFGPVLLFLETQRHVPLGGLQVALGECLLPFEALHPDGSTFRSDALRGQRVLLKFFRGHWCPFCSAELRSFDAMQDALSHHGVRVIALSKDTPAEASHHRDRDRLRLTLLCDPSLQVIRKFGIEHQKALEVSGGRLSILGFPLGRRVSFQSMAAPTTLLIDEHGRVRWIDQTDDYRVRGDAQRVLSAVEHAFGEGPNQRPVANGTPATGEPAIAPCY